MSFSYDLTGKRVWVAGHRGMVGSGVVRRLANEPIGELITATSAEVDLRRQEPTEAFVAATQPDVIVLAVLTKYCQLYAIGFHTSKLLVPTVCKLKWKED